MSLYLKVMLSKWFKMFGGSVGLKRQTKCQKILRVYQAVGWEF